MQKRQKKSHIASKMNADLYMEPENDWLGNTEQIYETNGNEETALSSAPVFFTSNNLRSNRCVYDLLGSFLNLLPLPH